ncbi:MAG: hypothetical protein V7603_3328 [Micromonosporaceae bacterium]
MTAADQAGGPTVRRMQLGSRLRRLREDKGISRGAAGYAIRASESKISRMELGRVGVKPRDIADLLALYDVSEAEREVLTALTQEANSPGWWHPYGDLLATWFQNYLDLEAAATLIRCYEVQFVPGLLQTEEYARAVIQLGYGDEDPTQVDRRVRLRMVRKQLLDRPDAPRLWAVIDEAVLSRPIGGPGAMRRQIEALRQACTHPAVWLQILPFHAGGHAAAGGAFTILRFGEAELTDVIYIEHLTSALYLDRRDDVDKYTAAAGRLVIEAEPPERTPAILDRLLADYPDR